jgi:molybdopterin synthase catalytic subunit
VRVARTGSVSDADNHESPGAEKPLWRPDLRSEVMIEITAQPIDIPAVLASVTSAQCGAVVLFLGTTREFTEGRQTLSLDYECYGEMAEKKLFQLQSQARERWALSGCSIVHRIGHVPLAEASVAIAVSSPHRQAAFAAGQWLIDTLKQVVPIWKREHWADGSSQWVHPGMESA